MARHLRAAGAVEAGPQGVGLSAPDRRQRSRLSITFLAALAAVWILWGSTFAGMRFAVATIPPFAMTSLRFTVAGLMLYALCAALGRGRVRRADLVRATVTGAMLLLFGTGMMSWTVQYLPTGINSLLLSVSPIWMALVAFFWLGERPTRIAIVGMVIGLAGLALLLAPRSHGTLPVFPTVLTVLSSMCWAFGSVYARRSSSGDLVLATALQMIVGGLLLAVEAAFAGEWQRFDVHAISAASYAGFAWLVICGSLLGYSAYLYVMQNASTALASTYAYINPLVAVVLGVLLFGERFTLIEGIAGAIILIGVALMMLPARRTA